MAEFEAEMIRRTPAQDVARAEELDRRAMAGEGRKEDLAESFRLFWSAYFWPAARIVVVDDVGHFPWLERPGEIRSALDRVAAQPG
ncbi:MAG: hypothetical protein M3042_07030 [Actinomycetota bacterium]|nr:hypothetical protein [Actinomycetota bacterium]